MKILVLMRMTPDVVEELEIAPDGKALDAEACRMILAECDEHALEQAILLKEQGGGEVIALAPEAPEVDDALFTAMAKGADRAIKIQGLSEMAGAREAAAAFVKTVAGEADLSDADLILTGVQANADVDANVGAITAEALGRPFLGIVTQVRREAAGKAVTAVQEFSGGVRAEYELDLPAVLGIQAAEKPPRYVPVAKVRATMKAQKLGEAEAVGLEIPPGAEVVALAKPEETGQAEMLEGSAEAAAAKLCEVLAGKGLL